MPGASAAEHSARNTKKLLLRHKIFFAMSLITKLTLILILYDPYDDAKML